MNLVGDGVADRVEPASASGLVEPALIVPALWILTFENVSEETLDTIAPVLDKKGIPYSLFITPDNFVSDKARKKLEEKKRREAIAEKKLKEQDTNQTIILLVLV